MTPAPTARSTRSSASGPTTTGRPPARAVGSVAFVGTGPGDPGLLTLRAVDAIAGADVLVLDTLLGESDLARWLSPGVEVLDAGFGEDGQPLTHAGRAKLVTRAAKSGKRVVRLMDGDPAARPGCRSRSCRASRRSVRCRPTPASR